MSEGDVRLSPATSLDNPPPTGVASRGRGKRRTRRPLGPGQRPRGNGGGDTARADAVDDVSATGNS